MKWDSATKHHLLQRNPTDVLPMWVADMDFKSPEPVRNALHNAVSHGVFGYPNGLTQGYVQSVIGWQKKRFQWDVSPEWLVPISGIIVALKTIIQTFSAAGDSILIQLPVYGHFHNDVLLNGRRLACAPLVLNESRYVFDAKIFEDSIHEDTKIFILCNPHNPTGNVWSENELRTMGEICFAMGY